MTDTPANACPGDVGDTQEDRAMATLGSVITLARVGWHGKLPVAR